MTAIKHKKHAQDRDFTITTHCHNTVSLPLPKFHQERPLKAEMRVTASSMGTSRGHKPPKFRRGKSRHLSERRNCPCDIVYRRNPPPPPPIGGKRTKEMNSSTKSHSQSRPMGRGAGLMVPGAQVRISRGAHFIKVRRGRVRWDEGHSLISGHLIQQHVIQMTVKRMDLQTRGVVSDAAPAHPNPGLLGQKPFRKLLCWPYSTAPSRSPMFRRGILSSSEHANRRRRHTGRCPSANYGGRPGPN